MLCASKVFWQRDAARMICITRMSCLEQIMSNYTNHIVYTQYDLLMKDDEWALPVNFAA